MQTDRYTVSIHKESYTDRQKEIYAMQRDIEIGYILYTNLIQRI